jgi:signal transduction histidine kinase
MSLHRHIIGIQTRRRALTLGGPQKADFMLNPLIQARSQLGTISSSGDLDSRTWFGAGSVALCTASILAIGTAIECHRAAMNLVQAPSWIPSLVYGSVLWIWWAGVAYLFWLVGARYSATPHLSWPGFLILASVGTGNAFLHLYFLHLTCIVSAQIWQSWRQAGFGDLRFFEVGRFGLEFFTYILIWALCSFIQMQVKTRREAYRSLQLEQQLSMSKLHALQMQIQPHFLFNTLNALTTLVKRGRQEEAVALLSHLSMLLKMTLSSSTPHKIPLAQELQLVDCYLAIEQTRFGDRLQVTSKVEPDALDGLVPSFLLQPIVENAIKHGIADRERDGEIRTEIVRMGEQLHLQVEDNGSGSGGSHVPGHGIGLSNTRERLHHFYPGSYELIIAENEHGGCTVSIAIPFERAIR